MAQTAQMTSGQELLLAILVVIAICELGFRWLIATVAIAVITAGFNDEITETAG